MNTFARVLTFGVVSGLFWSAFPNVLGGPLSRHVDLPATAIAGVFAGVVTSLVLASVLARAGRALTVVFGLLSLPLGVVAFSLVFALIDRFFPSLTSNARALGEPWTIGFGCGLIPIFAIGLFPFAVFTTLVLRAFVVRGSETHAA
jgi:hypothetical protein